jgi:hypothetical protein
MRLTRKRRRALSTASKPNHQPAFPLSHARPQQKRVVFFAFTPVITALTLDMYTLFFSASTCFIPFFHFGFI